jgi:hypothetical protein
MIISIHRSVIFASTLLVALGLGRHEVVAQTSGYDTVVYSTDFSNYIAPASAAGQQGWYTTSKNTNGPGAIEDLNWTVNGITGANSFTLGGYPGLEGADPRYPGTMPDANMTTLLHAANTGINSVFINSTFDLYTKSYNPITGANATQSALGFSIYNTTGYDLMDIMFTPVIAANNTVSYTMGVVSYGNDNTTLATQNLTNTFSGNQITMLANNFVNMGVAVTGIGTANQSIATYTYQTGSTNYYGTTQILYNNFSSSAYNDGNTNVGAIGMSWYITDGSTNSAGNLTNFGANTMVVQNITAAIPEPKTWVLFGISALIMVVAIRRRA